MAAIKDCHGGFSRGEKAVSKSAEDLQEDEVWAMMKATEDSKPHSGRFNSCHGGANGRPEFSTTTKRATRGESSAPVDIPDRRRWSRIMKKRYSRKIISLWDDDACDHAHSHDVDYGYGDEVKSDDDDDGDGDEMVPPHEYLARRVASSQISSFSMCEGVGRTLKGRDLSKLRNTILTKTGFIE